MKVIINDIQYIPAPDKLDGKDHAAALAVRFDCDAGSQITVRDYFMALLLGVWEEEEGFNGKRPFGNSGWQHEVINALACDGFIDLGPSTQYDGWVSFEEVTKEQRKAAHKYVLELIKYALTPL